MSAAAIFEAVRERFATEVATPNSLTVYHDNAPQQSIRAGWYVLEVQATDTVQVHAGATGERRYRMTGQAILTMAVRAEKGDAALLELADDVTTAFRGVTLTDPIIYFGVPTLAGDAAREDGWFQRVMTIPFEADTFG